MSKRYLESFRKRKHSSFLASVYSSSTVVKNMAFLLQFWRYCPWPLMLESSVVVHRQFLGVVNSWSCWFPCSKLFATRNRTFRRKQSIARSRDSYRTSPCIAERKQNNFLCLFLTVHVQSAISKGRSSISCVKGPKRLAATHLKRLHSLVAVVVDRLESSLWSAHRSPCQLLSLHYAPLWEWLRRSQYTWYRRIPLHLDGTGARYLPRIIPE